MFCFAVQVALHLYSGPAVFGYICRKLGLRGLGKLLMDVFRGVNHMHSQLGGP
jgi:hypothetical protein